MTQRDYYEVLGLEKTASNDEIKRAYRKLAMQYHPDRNPGDKSAEDKFKEAAEAYGVLSDADKRKRYDQFGHAGMKGTDFREYSDFNDIFSSFRDIFTGAGFGSSIFDDFFGGASQQRGGKRKNNQGAPGNDLKITLKLSLEEISQGIQKKIKIKRFQLCDACNGTGGQGGTSFEACPICRGTGEIRQVSKSVFGQFVNITACHNCEGEGKIVKNPCMKCNGDGRVRGENTVSVTIPQGVVNGNYLTLRSEGDIGKRKGPSGDLIVIIEELAHDVFRRDGDDIIYILNLSIPEAILGGEIEVPTLTGKAKIKIEPGMNPGKILRMKGKGIPNLNGYKTGDELIQLNVFIPSKISNSEKEIVKGLMTSGNFNPKERSKKPKNIFEQFKDAWS